MGGVEWEILTPSAWIDLKSCINYLTIHLRPKRPFWQRALSLILNIKEIDKHMLHKKEKE